MECRMVGEHYGDSALSFPTPAPTLLEWPCQEKCGSGSTASAPVSDVSAPACTNGVCPLRPVNVAQKNKPSTMLSFNVQSIDLMDCKVLDDETIEWLLNTCPEI